MWWPVSLTADFNNDIFKKSLILWLNSTLNLIMLLTNRQETEGPWIDFKKPVLAQLPVLDLTALSNQQRQMLADTFDDIRQEPLQPFPAMASDPVRAKIDAAVAQALGLPDFGILRQLLAREPVVCLQRLSSGKATP